MNNNFAQFAANEKTKKYGFWANNFNCRDFWFGFSLLDESEPHFINFFAKDITPIHSKNNPIIQN